MKEIAIVKYVSLKYEASITEFEGSVFVLRMKTLVATLTQKDSNL